MDYLYSPFQEVWVNDHLVADNSSKEYKTSNKVFYFVIKHSLMKNEKDRRRDEKINL